LIHLAQLFGELRDLRVGLVIPSQGIDTSSPETNPGALLQLNILSAVASWERDLISIRTKDALRIRKSRGIKLGRPEMDITKRNKAEYLLKQGMSASEIAKTTGVSIASVYRIRNFTKVQN
jgi:DNA invertase Pin-like site-specific DNA recombinase